MKLSSLFAALVFCSAGLHAQTLRVSDAWARATVPGQTASGAFMKIESKEDAVLVGVSSPRAEIAEIHAMKMDAGVMKMHAVPELALPAGTPVELKPGGYHVMLMDIKGVLRSGANLPLVLHVRDRQGRVRALPVSVPVRMAAPAAGAH